MTDARKIADERDQWKLQAQENEARWGHAARHCNTLGAERDRLRTECNALRAALRKHCITKHADFRGRFIRCDACGIAWTGDEECHDEGCLAVEGERG